MSEPDEKEKYYSALGLSPDATFEQVKSRFRELNDAYLKILELSRAGAKGGTPARAASTEEKTGQHGPQQNPKQQSSPAPETRTEPIGKIKSRFAKGEIQKAQFEKLAKERWNYLKGKPFSELSDAEYEERIHGFDGLKFL
jgi:hypothetical protein